MNDIYQYFPLTTYSKSYIILAVVILSTEVTMQTRNHRSNNYRAAVQSLKVEAKERQAWEPCENYRRLVCQQAWWAWKRLPAHAKAWIHIDDLINHGMWLVYRYITKDYNKKRSDAIITGLQHVLHNVFVMDYLRVNGAWHRGWHQKDGKLVPMYMTSLEKMQADELESGKPLGIPDLITSEDPIISNALTKCFVIPAITEVYNQASFELKQEIVNWFWYRKLKVHTKSKPFQKSAKEFRMLADIQKLTCDDCLHLVRSPECLDVLSREVFGIPWDTKCSPVVN